METEKLLPQGEPSIEIVSLPETMTPAESAPTAFPGVPSPEAQQWGVVISIVVIVLMIVVGAFYSWGKRIAQENELSAPITAP